MDKALKAKLSKDPDGLQTYEFIANNIQEIVPILAIDCEKYASQISRLIEAAIDKDRERNYLAQLLPSIWGEDYEARHEELNASDNNFRRIYKRVYPAGI